MNQIDRQPVTSNPPYSKLRLGANAVASTDSPVNAASAPTDRLVGCEPPVAATRPPTMPPTPNTDIISPKPPGPR